MSGAGVFSLIVLVLLYFIPSFIASKRDHHQFGSIVVLNLFLGWTFLGWLAALIWSFSDVKKPVEKVAVVEDQESTVDLVECPMCAEQIKAKAKVCRFCGHEMV